jgi:hypothetical protein
MLLASLSEALTGLGLLVFPALVVRLLFGIEIDGIGVTISRLAGIALIGLGVACWPRVGQRLSAAGMLLYSSLAGIYLIIVGIQGGRTGVLLWPAAAVHLAMSLLFAIVSLRKGRP